MINIIIIHNDKLQEVLTISIVKVLNRKFYLTKSNLSTQVSMFMIERINLKTPCKVILHQQKIQHMKKILTISLLALIIASCGGNKENKTPENSGPISNGDEGNKIENGNPAYDPNRGEGKFKDVQVDVKLNTTMAEAGNKTFDVKCSSCHKLTDEKLVGPGWLGVTQRRQNAWIMNFITNTDEMLNKDPQAQAQLEICLVRMPNQSLSDDEARNLLEFMRKNDGVK